MPNHIHLCVCVCVCVCMCVCNNRVVLGVLKATLSTETRMHLLALLGFMGYVRPFVTDNYCYVVTDDCIIGGW